MRLSRNRCAHFLAIRRPHPAIRAAPAIVCPSATAKMILARLTIRCGIACERAQISSSSRSAAFNSTSIGVFAPIPSSLTELLTTLANPF